MVTGLSTIPVVKSVAQGERLYTPGIYDQCNVVIHLIAELVKDCKIEVYNTKQHTASGKCLWHQTQQNEASVRECPEVQACSVCEELYCHPFS